MGSWIFEVPFLVALIWLAIQLAERSSNLIKSAAGLALVYSGLKALIPLAFGGNFGTIIIIGIVEFVVSLIYFYLVLRLYGNGLPWWFVTILGALVFLLTNL